MNKKEFMLALSKGSLAMSMAALINALAAQLQLVELSAEQQLEQGFVVLGIGLLLGLKPKDRGSAVRTMGRYHLFVAAASYLGLFRLGAESQAWTSLAFVVLMWAFMLLGHTAKPVTDDTVITKVAVIDGIHVENKKSGPKCPYCQSKYEENEVPSRCAACGAPLDDLNGNE